MLSWLAVCASLALGAPVEDGSLLFLENCNSVVQWTGDGRIGHVAMVFSDAGEAYLYEATPGLIRRVKLADYAAELTQINARRGRGDPIRALLLRPRTPYTSAETEAMHKFLDEQIGRRYSVRAYVRSKPGDGIHCAQLTSETLNRSGRFDISPTGKMHPSVLYQKVLSVYQPAEELPLETSLPAPSFLERLSLRWSEYWTFCRWSWREAWLWCW